jgi:hypothetical protein
MVAIYNAVSQIIALQIEAERRDRAQRPRIVERAL